MPNLKLAVRTLLRTPFVTGIAIASLALGIGANTAIFSLIQRILLRPLPVPEPDRLVNIEAGGPNPGSQTCNAAGNCQIIFSYPMFKDLEQRQTGMTGIAGMRIIGADLAYKGRTLSGEGVVVSGSYFGMLGIRPALGRLLTPEDDKAPGASPLVVLSHSYWSNELGSDPEVLNATIMVNGHSMTVVGVAEKGFEGTTLGVRPRVFMPLTMRQVMEGWGNGFEDRRSYWVYVLGRLKPGVTREAAEAQLNAVYTPIIADVELPLQKGIPDQMLAEFKVKKIHLVPGSRGMSSIHGRTTSPLGLLFAVTAIVLLVACTNVANLLLARAAARSSEMAVRSSLGAARGQLVQQLLAESAILAIAAGGASLLVARWTLILIHSFLPSELVNTLEFTINGPVLAFAAAVSLGTSLLFGLLPALHSTRSDLLTVTKTNPGRGSASRSTTRFRNGLVTAQIALSMALLCSAGLFIRSLTNVARVELGLRPDSVVTFAVSPGQIGFTAAQNRALFQRLETQLTAIPGVTGVTSALVPLLHDWSSGGDVDVDGFVTQLGSDVNARVNIIGPDFFKTIGIPMVAGREFNAGDDEGTPKVAIVNEAFAKKFNLLPNPIGKRMRIGNALASDTRKNPDYEIIGMSKNAAYNGVKEEIEPLYSLAYRQDTTIGRLVYYVRTRQSPAAVEAEIPRLVGRIEPTLPVAELKTMPQQINENVFLDRMITTFSSGFAALATLLAAVGLYGVLAYTVSQRTREIGLRMALGADGSKVRGLVLRQVGLMTAIGGVVGIAAAFGIGRSAQSLLFGLKGNDLLAFGSAALVLTAVALSAGFIPARRAAQVHPMEALRAD